MSPTVKIRPGATDEETIPATTKWTRTREIGKMRRARITVPREDATAVTLNEKEDDIELVGVDTLRLVDIETGGPEWVLVCFSYEWVEKTVEPTAGGNTRSGSDADLVNGWITDVPEWSAGTVTQQATGLEFVFNHASPAEGLRRIEKNVPGELLFRDTGTVDYINRLGSDKTGSVTLSAANQTIEDEISITKRGRELDGTHIRVLGAHEGEAQFFANLVPSDDSATYENRVNYSTSRWSDGDTRDWDRYSNKDVTDQATIEEEAAELGTEITERLVEAKATTTLDLEIGDSVQVTKSDADLDRSMRVHRVKEISHGGTTKRELLLSTRTIMRSDDSEDLRDIQRFNSGFQGSSVVVQGGGSRQPVDAQNNAELPFYYPELEFENKAELFVRGLKYRHYSVPNKHDHDVTVTHPEHNHDVIISTTSEGNTDGETVDETGRSTFDTTVSTSSYETIASFSTAQSMERLNVNIDQTSLGGTEGLQLYLKNEATNEFYPSSTTPVETLVRGETNERNTTRIDIPADVSGDTIKLQAKAQNGNETRIGYQWFSDGTHVHDISDTETSDKELGTTETSTSDTAPGVTAGINETSDTPTGVDVKLGGTTLASDIGSGTFRTTVDITGDLTKGAWNLLGFTSDDLGHIQATVSVSGYDQIGTE